MYVPNFYFSSIWPYYIRGCIVTVRLGEPYLVPESSTTQNCDHISHRWDNQVSSKMSCSSCLSLCKWFDNYRMQNYWQKESYSGNREYRYKHKNEKNVHLLRPKETYSNMMRIFLPSGIKNYPEKLPITLILNFSLKLSSLESNFSYWGKKITSNSLGGERDVSPITLISNFSLKLVSSWVELNRLLGQKDHKQFFGRRKWCINRSSLYMPVMTQLITVHPVRVLGSQAWWEQMARWWWYIMDDTGWSYFLGMDTLHDQYQFSKHFPMNWCYHVTTSQNIKWTNNSSFN